MGRITPNYKKQLVRAIELLHEVDMEVREAKPFFASICRSTSQGLETSMEDYRYLQFNFDVPRGKFHRLGLSPWDTHDDYSVDQT